jgi:hypothetical protein
MIRLLQILLTLRRLHALCVEGTLPPLLSANSSLPQPWMISTDARAAEGPVCDVVAKVSLLECVRYRNVFSIEYMRRGGQVIGVVSQIYIT